GGRGLTLTKRGHHRPGEWHLSAAFHKYGEAPRAARRPGSPTRLPRWGPHPHRKARGGRIPGVFDRRATQRGGMHRRPNATVFMKVSTKPPGHLAAVRARPLPIARAIE